MKNYIIFDIEANGLLYEQKGKDVADRIWCLCALKVTDGWEEELAFTTYDEIGKFIRDNQDTHQFVAHNGIRYDKPMLHKFITDTTKMKVIDTLALSWYLYPKRDEHGLESWGETLGIAKPKVEDWQNGTIEEYLVRCREDVRINASLFRLMITYLDQIYIDNTNDIQRLISYLMFKMDCAAEQEAEKWLLDRDLCEKNLVILLAEQEIKKKALIAVMPKITKYVFKEKPKKCYLKDGVTPSELGKKWFALLKENNLPEYYVGAIKIPVKEEEGNPNSHSQIKDWLFSLGWQPDNIKPSKSKKTGEVKMIPQVANKDGNDISDSVKELYDQAPELIHLEGYYVINHRIGLLNGFLENVNSQNYLQAQVKGLTNTLRFQHTTLVNLPTMPKPYWKMIRGCLIAEEGYELCGSDMSSLEDNTKQHYMMYFDPEYVKEMRTPGFDPHIDISKLAKAMSHDEGEFYKWYDKKKDGKVYEYIPKPNPTANSILSDKLTFDQLISIPDDLQAKIIKTLKPIRLKNKKVNFAAVYGAGANKLAITAGISVSEAKVLHTTYWIRNKSVKQVAEACIFKTIGEQAWLFNPVSRFWYSLREVKDRFSTLNQSTGVYCFDTWLSYVRKQGIKLIAQFHDEKVSRIKIEPDNKHREIHKEKLQKAIQLTNEQIRLNVPLNISVDFGKSYMDIH